MTTKIQVVDSMSSVLDMQVLAIEKALLSIDRFLNTNMSGDIAKLITSFNISLRSMVSKALEKVSTFILKCCFCFMSEYALNIVYVQYLELKQQFVFEARQ